MTCVELNPNAWVCGLGRLAGRTVLYCPTCERRRRFLKLWGGAWYPETVTCTACGDSWSEGWRHERPFARGWRKREIARARKIYYTEALDYRDYRRETRADLRAAFPG